MKKVGLIIVCFLALVAPSAYGQLGKIVKHGNDLILNPNLDEYVTKSGLPFSSQDYNVPEFEISMFGIPIAGGDATGDNIGKSCGIADLIPDTRGYATYAVRLADADNNLIFRFRVGDNNSSVEAWTILLDTDGLFGMGVDPNATAENPGFEIDITLIKNPNQGVWVYNIDGVDKCPNPLLSYPLDTHFQIAIADEQPCGSPAYFYDYYVPFREIANALNINVNTGLRFAAVTNVSATCAMGGKISDVSGVDDTDYSGCYSCMFSAVIDAQCPTAILDLCQTCAGFEKDKVSKPTIDQPLVAGQRIIDGTTVEQNIFVLVQVFTNIGTSTVPKWDTVSAPRIQKGVYSIGTIWRDTLPEPLLGYDKVRAIAKKTEASVPCGGAGGNQSSATSVTSNPVPFPVAQNQSVAVNEDTPLDIILGPPDPDNFILGYSVVTNPTHGTLGAVNSTTHKVTYVPNLNYNGPDNFTFKLTDGTTYQSTATVSITVNPVNDAPVADSQRGITTPEDTPKNITLTATDVDGDALTYIIVTAPAHGSVSLTGAVVTYTPAANYFGQDGFTFKVNDGTGNANSDSNVATVSINVTPVNDAPVAIDQNITVVEDTPKAIVLSASDVDGNGLTYAIATSPAHGTLSGTAPNLTYSPAANYNGSDSFTFKANDGTVDSNTATVSITVTPVNDTPIANAQSVSTPEDTPVGIMLTGSDVDGNSLTYSIGVSPTHGTLSGAAPNLTYTPAANYNGPDNFTFTVNDGTGSGNAISTAATVSITVTPVNDTPIANAQSVSTPEDTPVGITLTGSDVDGNGLTYSIGVSPTHGTLSGAAPNLTYTPAANYNGSDSFTFTVNDGTGSGNAISTAAMVSITVTPVNDAPIANAQSVSTPEDTPVGIMLTGSDVDGNSLTYTIGVSPTHGTLSGVAPNLTYTPAANYNGPDNFTFTVNDGTGSGNAISTAAMVSITVTPVNDTPIANAQSVSTPEDTPVGITLTGSDVDGNGLTYSIGVSPTHGTLSGAAPNLTYTPDPNYNGSDSFTFTVNDGTGSGNAISTAAMVSITVTPVNDAPIANAQSVSTPEDTPVGIMLTGSDVDGNSLTYSIGVSPAHGTLSGTAPNLTYTPSANYNGPDSFTFTVDDGTGSGNAISIAATVSITVTPVNDTPIANAQSVSTPEDTPVGITLTGSDVDGNGLTYSIGVSPTHGTLSGAAPNLTYIPDPNYNGSDSFTFTVDDGTGSGNSASSAATVSITVTPVNDAPIANSQSVNYVQNVAKGITLTGSDPDGDAITFIIISAPSHGTLTGTAPNVTFTPNSGYTGTDNFTFQVSDGTLLSNVATVFISLTPASNVAPVAFDQTVTVTEDVPKLIILTASDDNGDPLIYSFTSPAHGTLSGTAPNLTYSPAANYNGSDSFTFKANDGTVDSNTATVSITVTPVNDTPIANAQSVSTPEDTPVGIMLTGSDVDGNSLTYSIGVSPTHGTLSGAAPNLTYTPAANYNGPDNFTFTVNDGTGSGNAISTAATVSITVTPVNDAPIANAQSVSTPEDTPVGITLTGSDVDGNGLTYSIGVSPTHGTLSGVAPNLTYTPAANYNGSDSFTFTVNDGTGSGNAISTAAMVSITVTPVNDAPIANAQSVSTPEDTPVGIMLTGSDVDGNSLTYTIGVSPTHGTLSGAAPNLTYTPAANYNGPDNFTFTVNDGTGSGNAISIAAMVSITVTPVNDTPIANAQSVSTPEDTPAGITLTGSDVDGNGLTYSIGVSPTHGTLSGAAPNLTYTPDPNYNGSDSFTFTVNDGTGSGNAISTAAMVSITVTPVNDTPIANAQSVSTPEDMPVGIMLTGSDVDGNSLTYSIGVSPAHGTLTGAAPNLTYTPDPNYNGSDSFTFTVDDGTGSGNAISTAATVSISVTPVNHPPVANSQSGGVTLAENSTTTITLTGSDVDGNALTYIVVTPPSHGTLSGTAPNLIYTPDLYYNGNDSFTFKVNDGLVDSNVATVDIVVTPVNQAPTADNQSVTVLEDASTAVNLSGSDIDGNPLAYTVVTPPSHGTLSGTAPNLTYTPTLYFNGSDNFTFKVNDGTVDSNIATVSITITPVNHAPVAVSQTGGVTLVENSAVPITLIGTDVDGNALTFIIVTPPTHGTLTGTGPNVTYTPVLNYSGPDSFTFKVNDGFVDSNIATVSIAVTPLDNPPVADDQSVATQEDIAKAITLTSSDIDGDLRAYLIVAGPLHGTLTGTAPNLTYTPVQYYNGSDAFTFKANDGLVDSNIATVSITITPVNDAPVISLIPDLYMKEDTVRLVCLNVIDVDGDQIIFGQPSNSKGGGAMSKAAAPYDFCYTFSPAANYNGESIWDLQVCDTGGLCGSTSVKIIITPVNDPPYAANDEIAVNSRQATTFNVMDNDAVIAPPYKEFYDIFANDTNYKDVLTMTTVPLVGPFNGTVQMSADGTVSYTPKFDYVGPDSIKYKICDSGNLCATAVAFITVGYPPFKIYEGVSPNGDNLNDYWRIDGIELFPNNLVRVYDRFDNVVFETTAYSNEKNNWQGQSNHGLVHGTLPEGTYFYTLDLGNGDKTLSGYVELKRH